MGTLLLWSIGAVVVSHLCSLLEVTLLSVRPSALLERQAAGSVGAARLLAIKRDRIEDAIGAVLVLNTLAITVGATLAGAQAAALFGDAGVGVFSAVLTVLLLVLAEIIPKTLAARHASRLAAFTGRVLPVLMAALAPLLAVTRAIVDALARRPRDRLTRREFALFVGAAPQEGAITLAEAQLIGNLIYSRDVLLREVMTPHAMIFMMAAEQTVADLLRAAGADAFSRIPLYAGDRHRITGYVSHREVLKAAALGADPDRPLDALRRPIPVLHDSDPVVRAFERVLVQRESIALVADAGGRTVGLVTIEDMLEAILGLEITDEAETVAALRPAVAKSRRQRAESLRRKRSHEEVPAEAAAAPPVDPPVDGPR